MKGYGKLYIQTVSVSVLISALPFALERLDVISKVRLFDSYALLFALIALIISIEWVCLRVKSIKHRLMLIFMNPVVYYAIGWVCVLIAFRFETSWDGFYIGG